MAKAIGCFTSASPAKSVALKPGGRVIALTASSGERPANLKGWPSEFSSGAAAKTRAARMDKTSATNLSGNFIFNCRTKNFLLLRLRLRFFPLGLAHLFCFVKKYESPLFIAHDYVWKTFVLNISRHDLRAHAGIVINQMGNEINLAIAFAHKLEPVKHRGRFRVGIAMVAMR